MTTKLSKSMAMSLALGFSVLVTPNAQSAPTKAIPAPANQKNAASKKIDFAPVERDILQAKFGAAETKLKAIMTSSDSLHALHLLGLTYLKQQRLSDAEPVFQKAIDSSRKSFGDKSPAYAQALADMASLYALKGDVALAWKNNDEALAIIDAAKGNNYLEKASVNLAIARTRQTERSLGLADDFFKKALDQTMQGSNKGENKETDSPLTLLVCQEYALVLEKMERKDEAKKLNERVTLAKTLTPSSSLTPLVIDAKAGINKLIADAKKVEDAKDLDKTIEAWKSTIAAIEKANIKDERLAYSMVHLGSALIEKKNYAEAQAILKKALEVRKSCSAPQNAGMARNLRRIGDCYMLEKNWDDAKNFLVLAYEAEEAYGADDATKNTTLNKLASSCLQGKDYKKGENACRQILVLAEKSDSPAKSIKKMMATSMLAGILMQSGRMQEGMQLMQNMSGNMQMNAQNTQEYTAALKAEWEEVEKKSEEAELKTIFQ
ncbi:MAG: tetratricopeptide repeat protein [Candidatus Melainabacteria bacterium]|nr:MAG: tetratricopeptide repeat protein [Candidatus Melainabacteria bacterium]